MVTAALHDPLKRAFNVMPSQSRFGAIRAGGTYEVCISCKNEDQMPQRLTVRQGQDKRVRVYVEKPDGYVNATVATGAIRRVIVQVRSEGDADVGKLEDEF